MSVSPATSLQTTSSNYMPIFNNVLAGAAGSAGGAAAGYEIQRSLRFNSADEAHLERNITTAGNQRKMTFSFWIKRNSVDSSDESMIVGQDYDTVAGNHVTARSLSLHFSGNQLKLYDYGASTGSGDTGSSSAWTPGSVGNGRLFRDPSAWYHCVFAIDTTQATAANRCKVWINGESQTYSSQPPQNVYLSWGQVRKHYIGIQKTNGSFTRAGNFQLSEFHFIDGQQLTASDFGEPDATTGVWNPIEYTGTYGTNGFYLDFSDNSSNAALGTDSSGNSNTWTVNSLSVASGSGNDSLIDTPTNYTATSGNNGGNYATWNPLDNGGIDLSNGNLDVSNGAAHEAVRATFKFPATGKWYCECTHTSFLNSATVFAFGVSWSTASTPPGWGGSNVIYVAVNSASRLINTGGSDVSNVAATTNGAVLQVAYDADSEKLWLGFNNSWYDSSYGLTGNPSTGANATKTSVTDIFPIGNFYSSTGAANFGQRPFAYTPPTGYLSLCTQNFGPPAIADGSTAMDTKLYTGDGTGQTITGLGFSPDLVWIKQRNATRFNVLFDTVRGANKRLISDSSAEESTQTDHLSAFTSDGFTVQTSANVNVSSGSYVGWAWDAGTTTDTNNTAGSITPTGVRANASAGFSIVSYTGNGAASATIGHGLNAAPEMIMVKNRDVNDHGAVYHVGTDATNPQNYFLKLFETTAGTAARSDVGAMWNDTTPTSSVFSVGTEDNVNASTENYIAYCFAPVEGYSAFGSYTGNGSSSDGPFVYLGFRPAYVLFRNTGAGQYWGIYDSARDTYNGAEKYLRAEARDAEGSGGSDHVDFLSNGFKVRSGFGFNNGSGATILYAAFAENPFKYARAR